MTAHRLFHKSQTWRDISLAAQVLALIVMVLPGSYIWCNADGMYFSASYLRPDPYVFPWIWLIYGFAGLLMLVSFIAWFRRKSGLFSLLIAVACGGVTLWLEYFIPLSMAMQAIHHGHSAWLCFIPPVLSVVSVLTSVIAWFVGWREERNTAPECS